MSDIEEILVIHFFENEVAQQRITFIGKNNKPLMENLHV